MKFNDLKITDSKEILLEKIADERGFFSRLFCQEQMKKNNIEEEIKQINNSFNKLKGTIRGFHYQTNGYEESKILRCVSGSFFNVTIDLRKNSKTYCYVQTINISSSKRNMIYIPKGCANAVQILENNTEFLYFSSEFYSPKNERGIRWNDPFFQINWPLSPKNISQKDLNIPDFIP